MSDPYHSHFENADHAPTPPEALKEAFAVEALRKKLPDYFKALSMPWHLASDLLGSFVDDDEKPMGFPSHHARPLFSIAQALDAAYRRAQAEVESLKDWIDESPGMNSARALSALLTESRAKVAALQVLLQKQADDFSGKSFLDREEIKSLTAKVAALEAERDEWKRLAAEAKINFDEADNANAALKAEREDLLRPKMGKSFWIKESDAEIFGPHFCGAENIYMATVSMKGTPGWTEIHVTLFTPFAPTEKKPYKCPYFGAAQPPLTDHICSSECPRKGA